MSDSNVYIVSPPTLYMPPGGMAFCLISNDAVWQASIIEYLETNIQEQLTFYATDTNTKDPKAWVWYWHVVDNCGMIFVDLASCTEHEVRMALVMSKIDQPVIFHVKPGNTEFIALLNAVSIPFFEDMEHLATLLENGIG